MGPMPPRLVLAAGWSPSFGWAYTNPIIIIGLTLVVLRGLYIQSGVLLDVPLTGYTARLNSDREQAAWVLDILEANRRLAQEAGWPVTGYLHPTI